MTTMNALGELWTYRPCSDIASKVSSDGSSFVGPYFAHKYDSDEDDIEIQLLLDQYDNEVDDDGGTKETARFDNNTDDDILLWEEEADNNHNHHHEDVRDETQPRNGGGTKGLTSIRQPTTHHGVFGGPDAGTPQVVVDEQRQDTSTIAGWRSASTAPMHNTQTSRTTTSRQHTRRPRRKQRSAHGSSRKDEKNVQQQVDDDEATAISLFFRSIVCPWDSSSSASSAKTKQGAAQPGRKPSPQGKEGTVKVVVEATAICDLDWMMHPPAASPLDSCRAFWWDQDHEAVKGSNFVGVVHQCNSPDAHGISPGTRVAALVPGGAQARYITLSPQKLFVVPKHLDSSDICAVLSTYLPAFAALHHGRQRPYRYSPECLKGRNVLIVHAASLQAQAAVHLAQLAGAAQVHVTAPRDYHCVLQKHRPNQILGPKDWLDNDTTIQGKMDVVLDYQFPRQFGAVRAACAPKGRLVCHGGSSAARRQHETEPQHCKEESSSSLCCLDAVESCVLEHVALAMSTKRTTLFQFGEMVECEMDTVAQDLEFLLELLSTGQIRPDIDRFIGLNEVAKAHGDICRRPLYGSIICEPWKDS